MASPALHAAVSYQKLPGTLSMENTGYLKWTPSSPSAAAQQLVIDEKLIMALQVSAEGSKQTVMVLQLAEGAKIVPEGKKGLFFYFTGGVGSVEDKDRALADRSAFKNYLIDIVNQNKARASAPVPVTASTSGTASPSRIKSGASTPTTANNPAEGSRAKATPAAARNASTSKPGANPELELRISVLKANPALAVLHKDVVWSKQISDQEFWSHPTRRALLIAERAAVEQKQGRNARLADPRPTANEAGEMRINMTPELVRDMKAQHPVVNRAFEDNVPSKMDEATFWKRFFSSKLYHHVRTSARSQASQHTVQPDDILDKYIEKEDDGLEPRKQYNAHDSFLDLGATAEDHGETGNEKDWTMRAGVERKTLPLMRRFNDHSQSLLDSALGEQSDLIRRKRRAEAAADKDEGSEDSDDGIVIDELQEQDQNKRRKLLDMRQHRELFDGRGGERATEEGSNATRLATDASKLTGDQIRALLDDALGGWDMHLDGAIDSKSKDSSVAMKAILANVQSRQDARAWRKGNDLPDVLSKSLVSQNASSSEFLRQLWATITPQPAQDGTLAGNDLSTAQKRAKARRMLSSLRKSKDKFSHIIEEAQEGIERQRVSAAIVPVQTAIDKALNLPLGGESD